MNLLRFLLITSAIFALGSSAFAHEGSEEANTEQWPDYGLPAGNAESAKIPNKPELVEPSFMAKISGSSVNLKWKEVEGANAYHVQVATDPNFKWLVVNEFQHRGTAYEVKSLEANKHYFWRVFARNTNNDPGTTKSAGAKSMFMTN